MYGSSRFESNYDEKGPVFVDKDSRLILNENVTGINNLGGNNGQCDIFLEGSESTCLDGGSTAACIGTCCSFGDASCDSFTEPPTPGPSAEQTTKTPTGKNLITVNFGPSEEESNEKEESENESMEKEEVGQSLPLEGAIKTSGSGCGAGCKSVALTLPLLMSILDFCGVV